MESVINELGLKHCASTLVGNEWRKGISGGEKRRVSYVSALWTCAISDAPAELAFNFF